jgi:hypothetical protein
MYTRQEASQLRQQFWTIFGNYMAPVLSADGLKINWVNYKTGLHHVAFKMDTSHDGAQMGITLSHPDDDIRQLYFEQFVQLKHLLHGALEEEWIWQQDVKDEYGATTSNIYTRLDNVTIFKKEDWPVLISFFKPRITALDSFWDTAKYVFDALR